MCSHIDCEASFKISDIQLCYRRFHGKSRGGALISMHKVISLKKSQFILLTGRLFCLGDTCCGLKNCFSIDYNVASSFLMFVVVESLLW